ncbi:hypothetical protein GCM10010104_24660 [Streptomyces indiaensis]|uniref:Uncharacterized protein n=1 Tax=Streptomyces indiaensis TaxID=284033 RepID=A0ABN3DGG8_9ACTN
MRGITNHGEHTSCKGLASASEEAIPPASLVSAISLALPDEHRAGRTGAPGIPGLPVSGPLVPAQK